MAAFEQFSHTLILEQLKLIETLRLEAFEHIEQLIKEVRQCSTPEQYRLVQQHLTVYIQPIDASIGEAKIRMRHAEKERRKSSNRDLPDEAPEVQEILRKRDQAEVDSRLYALLARHYRLVGDAIAWQIYRFQALPIYDWGLNQGAGTNTEEQSSGRDAEWNEIERLWAEEGAFALRHDYTNCLRVGDLSVMYSGSSGLPEVREVKVKGRTPSSRQKRMLRKGEALIRDHRHVSEQTLYIQQTITTQGSTISLLIQAIEQASRESIGQATNDYLAVTVRDERNPAEYRKTDLQKKWEWLTGEFVPLNVWPILSNDYLVFYSVLKNTKSGFSAPYTIYPLPPDYVAALVTGYLLVHYQINTVAILQAFQNAGLNAVCKLGDWRARGEEPTAKIPSDCFVVGKGSWAMPIPHLSIEQLICDGLPLEDLVKSIIQIYKNNTLRAEASETFERFWIGFTYTSLEETWKRSLTYIESGEA